MVSGSHDNEKGGKEWDDLLQRCRAELASTDGTRERPCALLEELLEAVEGPVYTLADEVPPLMGAREAADALGVKVPNLRKMAGLPEPDQELASGPVWAATKIKALKRQRASRQPV